MKKSISLILAIILILATLASCAKPAPAAALTASELLDLGEKYLLELNYEQAIVQFLAVIEIEPMNARAYIGAAEAYLALGDTNAAIAILQQGLAATDDAAIADMLAGLEGAHVSAAEPDTASLPAELWVLTGQYAEQYFIRERYDREAYMNAYVSTYEYNSAGYVVRNERGFYDPEDEEPYAPSVRTFEYDFATGKVQEYYDGEAAYEADYFSPTPGGSAFLTVGLSQITVDAFPRIYRVGHMSEIDDAGRVENTGYGQYDFVDWHHAQYTFDANDNAARVDSYDADGRHLGYCEFTWAKLVLTSDGTYVSEG